MTDEPMVSGTNGLRRFQRVSGFGSVHGVPKLANGFIDMFESYHVPCGEVKLHVVIGGAGPPLLLLGGWPQNWYAWRYLMPSLARRFTIIAVDPRGTGLSDIPARGYDTCSQAADMLALMTSLGHERFAMIGHDIGLWTAFAMAMMNPNRLAYVALGEALIPGVSPSPPLLPTDRASSDFLWHHNFNRALGVNEELVRGREAIYFGHQFATKAGSPGAVPQYAINFYIEQLARSPVALRASFECYRALDDSIPQHSELARGRLLMPVLTFAGERACGPIVAAEIGPMADDLTSVIITGSGHYPAEEKPEELLEAINNFLDPYVTPRAAYPSDADHPKGTMMTPERKPHELLTDVANGTGDGLKPADADSH